MAVNAESNSTSRRALLAGALGGIGAGAASAIGRPSPTLAEGQTVVVGGEYLDATSVTAIANSANDADVFHAQSNGAGIGVFGVSTSGDAVLGYGHSGSGTVGFSNGTGKAAVVGHAYDNNAGVMGFSDSSGYGSSPRPPAPARTGVYGVSSQGSTAKGVYGKSLKGWAGYFAGRVYTSKYHEMKEVSTPAAPAANKARLFVRDNGSGKTQLCVRFNTGGVLVIRTQP